MEYKTRIVYSVSRIAGTMQNYFKSIRPALRGFTLVEMIVSVGLFAIVMLVCVGALLSLVAANRKVHALQSVMNNLNVTLDGMTRSMRMGSNYDGSTGCLSGLNGKDCTGGSTQFSFQPYGNPVGGQPWIYRVNNSRIERSINGQAFTPITSPDVTIESLTFYVVGSARGCDVPSPCQPTQPKVVVVVKGTAPVANSATKSTFHIEVTAVQRLLDI